MSVDCGLKLRALNKCRTLTAQGNIVKVGGQLDSLELATDVVVIDLAAQVRNSRVGWVVSAEHVDSLLDLVGLPDILDGDDGECGVITGVTEGDASTWHNVLALEVLLRDVERDRHGKDGAVGQAQGVNNAVIVGLVHEALEGAEATAEDELEITQLALCEYCCQLLLFVYKPLVTYVSENDVGEGFGFGLEGSVDGLIPSNEILVQLNRELGVISKMTTTDLENSTVGSVGHVDRLSSRVKVIRCKVRRLG